MPERSIKHEQDSQDKAILGFVVAMYTIAILAFIIAGVLYFKTFDGGLSQQHEIWGQAGDFFGGVLNPIISFAALLGLMLIILLEHQSLKAAKKELNATNKAFKEQNVNDRFFKMLDLVVRAEVEFSKTSKPEDYELLSEAISQVAVRYKRGDFNDVECLRELKSAFNSLALHEEFRAYVRSFGATFSYVSREALESQDKEFYLRTLSSVVRDLELFGFGLWVYFQGKFDPAVSELWLPFRAFASKRLVDPYKSMLEVLSGE